MKAKNTSEFFDDLDAFDTAMLVTRDGKYLRSRPMTPYVNSADGTIRFLTSRRTHKTEELAIYPEANIVFTDDSEVWISVSGKVRQSFERADIEELWSPAAEAFLQDGKDEAVVLIVDAEMAEYWDQSKSTLRAGWEMAKGAITGETPDVGNHQKLDL